MNQIRQATSVLILLSCLTGIIYPLVTTLIAQHLFPKQANGSFLVRKKQIIGSKVIGQSFTKNEYFWGRPSSTLNKPYDPKNSQGSNLAGNNPKLDQIIFERAKQLKITNPLSKKKIPIELLTSSASGLDPDISLTTAYWQIPRISKARGLSFKELEKLIKKQVVKTIIPFHSNPIVNVLKLNLALDLLKPLSKK